jgi:antitoxin component YwqK of YwqJK toxin-antitoxin module
VVGVSVETAEDYHDSEKLREAYERHDGKLKNVYAEFDASERHVRRLLVKHDIHEGNERQYYRDLENLSPEDVGLSPLPDDHNGGEH